MIYTSHYVYQAKTPEAERIGVVLRIEKKIVKFKGVANVPVKAIA
jgi:hypothetical protein